MLKKKINQDTTSEQKHIVSCKIDAWFTNRNKHK